MKISLLFLLWVGLLASSCSSSLTTSVCQDQKVKIPRSWNGTYRWVTLNQVPGLAGEGVFQEVYMKIDGPTIQEIYTDEKGKRLIKRKKKKGSFIVRARFKNSPEFFENLCRSKDGSFFSESQNSDGTYSLAEIYKNKRGLVFEGVIFLMEDLKTNQIPYFLVPKIDDLGLDSQGKVQRWANAPSLVVDNSKLSLDALLKYRTHGSVVVQLEKVDEKSTPVKKWYPVSL